MLHNRKFYYCNIDELNKEQKDYLEEWSTDILKNDGARPYIYLAIPDYSQEYITCIYTGTLIEEGDVKVTPEDMIYLHKQNRLISIL